MPPHAFKNQHAAWQRRPGRPRALCLLLKSWGRKILPPPSQSLAPSGRRKSVPPSAAILPGCARRGQPCQLARGVVLSASRHQVRVQRKPECQGAEGAKAVSRGRGRQCGSPEVPDAGPRMPAGRLQGATCQTAHLPSEACGKVAQEGLFYEAGLEGDLPVPPPRACKQLSEPPGTQGSGVGGVKPAWGGSLREGEPGCPFCKVKVSWHPTSVLETPRERNLPPSKEIRSVLEFLISGPSSCPMDI